MKLLNIFSNNGYRSTPTIVTFVGRRAVELSVSITEKSTTNRIDDFYNVKVSLMFYAAILTVALNSVALGSVIGYPSPMVPDINSIQAPFHLSDSDSISWASSINAIGQAIGCVMVGYPLDVFGRKRVILVNSVPLVFGWVIVAASTSTTWLLVGRFVTGLSSGMVPIAIPIYLAEIAPTRLRGRICSMGPASVNLGVLYVALVACILHYNWLAIACAAVPTLMAAIFIYMPETPRWLLAHGYTEAARESLTRLRSPDTDVGTLLGLHATPGGSRSKMAAGGGLTLTDFRTPQVYKPLLIMITLIWFQMFSGFAVVFVYSVSIFDAAHLSISPYVQSCVMGAVGLIGQIFSAAMVDRLGRKRMLTMSALIMSLSMMSMGVFDYVHIPSLAWAPAMCLLFYNFGMGLGFGPIPIYIGSEMFPGRMRGALCSIAICCWAIFFFLTTKFFLPLQDVVHNYGVFWIFAAVAAISVPFVKIAVPETTGKSLEEVQRIFLR